jgi:DNA-binding LacI/PurR family transcriptional regulator
MDVAKRTGVSVPTVSLALRNVGAVSPVTREKVKEAARSLGYRPNPLLASLAGKHFASEKMGGIPLAYIHVPETIANEEITLQHMAKTAQAHAQKLGYQLMIFNVGDFKDGAQAKRVLFSRGIQGVLLPHHFQLRQWPDMDWSRFSVVGWGKGIANLSDAPEPLLSRAAVDHFSLVCRAWQETWRRGYRKIGFAFFKPTPGSTDDQLRWGAAQACLQWTAQRLRIPPLVLKSESPKNEDAKDVGIWMRRYRPDAVIGFNAWFQWTLEDAGFRVPQDVGFVVLHIGTNAIKSPGREPFSGMREMRMKSVLAALELLDAQIRHHQLGLPQEPQTLLIHSEWIEGETLPVKDGAHLKEWSSRKTNR